MVSTFQNSEKYPVNFSKKKSGFFVKIAGHDAFPPRSLRKSRKLETTFHVFSMNPINRNIVVQEVDDRNVRRVHKETAHVRMNPRTLIICSGRFMREERFDFLLESEMAYVRMNPRNRNNIVSGRFMREERLTLF